MTHDDLPTSIKINATKSEDDALPLHFLGLLDNHPFLGPVTKDFYEEEKETIRKLFLLVVTFTPTTQKVSYGTSPIFSDFLDTTMPIYGFHPLLRPNRKRHSPMSSNALQDPELGYWAPLSAIPYLTSA